MAITESSILSALSHVDDPDLHKDIVQLGMVKNIVIDGKKVSFTVELTTPACPMKEEIKRACITAVKHLVEFFNTKTFSSSYGLDLSVLLQLLQQLTKYVGIEEVILFGSRAMGNFKSTSDIDLCLKGTLTENDLGEIKTLFEEGKVPYKVDVILYDSIKDPAILEHIKCFGKKIYP